ncbi:MAG: hypothetical protein ABIN18_05615 [Pseudomonadota bacterium]
MSLQSIIGDSRAPGEGFFGNISAAFETGLSKIGSEILPNWVQSQVTRQATNQLADNTYDSTTAPPRIEGQAIQDGNAQPTGIQKALWDLKIGNIGGGSLLLMGLVLVGIIFVLKKA